MKQNKTSLLIAIVILLLPYWGGAQTVHYYDLKSLLNFGLENSIAIRQAVKDQEQAEGKVGEVRSSGLPQLNGEGQFQNYINLPVSVVDGAFFGQPGELVDFSFGTKYNVTGTIEASQLLYSQEFFTGLKAAKSSRQLYSLMKIQTEEDVIYEVTSAYYQALQLQSNINILDSNLAMLEKLEKLMATQYENDIVTKVDYNRIKVNKVNLTTQLKTLKTNYTQQINYIKLLIGMPLEEEIALETADNIEAISLQSLEQTKTQHIALQILDQQKTLYELNTKSIQAGYYPTLSLFGQQAWQGQRNEFNYFESGNPWYDQTLWGATLNIPIFDGFQKHYKVQQSRIDFEKANLQQLNTERQLDMQYKNAQEQLVNSLASVEAQKENKALAKEVYEQTQLLYKEQVSNLTDLLDAEQAYREAQSNYFNEVLKFKQSELELLKAQGQLQTMIQ